MLLHASVESGICARNWGSRLQKARTATNVCFHLLSQATLRTLPDKSLAKRDTAWRTNHWSCNVHEKRLAKKREALLRLWSRLITLVTPDFFDRKVSSCIQRHRVFQQGLSTWPAIPETDVARAFQTFLQSKHRLVGLLTGTSWKFSEISSDIQVTYLLSGCMKVCCIVVLAGGHPSDCHLAIQFADYCQCLMRLCVCVCVSSVCRCVGLAF